MKTHSRILQLLSSAILISSLLMTSAHALEIPISQTEQMIDGRQTITQVFEVSPEVDPQTLIQEEIVQHGYRFTMASITKNVATVEDEKEITQEYSVVVNVSNADSARLEALMSMPAFIDYDEEDYRGKLYPVISSLSSRETGRTSHSGYNTIKKTYTCDYNDDSLVPTSSEGYSLSSITWSEGTFMEDSAIPENYVATATYRKGYSYSTVDGWEFTMSYVGDVTYEREDVVQYTLVYTGEPIQEPGIFEKIFGNKDSNTSKSNSSGSADASGPDSTNSAPINWGAIAGVICIIVALGAAGFGVYMLVSFLRNNRVEVYAEDPISGQFQQIKSTWFKSSDASITVDTMEAPSVQHFRVSMKPALAAKMKGKVVTLKAGQNIVKQPIGDAGGTEYTMDIDALV